MRIDHLVWYSADLAAGEKHFSGWTDAAPAFGGAHPGQGTRNSVLSLGDATYVEILARDPAQTGGTLDREIAALKGQGLYHWAVGGVDLAEVAARARQAGLDASAVVSGGRHLPDGNWLSWSLVGLRRHGFGALVPFFIDFRGNHPAATAPRGRKLRRHRALLAPGAAAGRSFREAGPRYSDLPARQAGHHRHGGNGERHAEAGLLRSHAPGFRDLRRFVI